jgi:hypothetical protein
MENEGYHDDKFREILNNKITSKISSVQRELVDFRSSFQNNAQIIIDNVSHILNSIEEQVLQDLREQVSALEAGLRGKLEPELRGRLETEIAQRVASELENRVSAAKQEGTVSSEEKLRSKLANLNDSLRDISLQKSQVDILMSFLDKAALFAPRVAFFVIKSGNIVGWQARGFEGAFNNESVKSLIFPPDRDSLLRKVYNSRIAFKGETKSDLSIQELVSQFGPLAPDSICAIPLVVRDKTVAIVYADSGLIPNYPLDCSPLEIMTTAVSLTVELSSARAKLGIKPEEVAPATQPKVDTVKQPVMAEGLGNERPVPPQRSAPPVVEAPTIPVSASTPPKEVVAEPPVREPSRIQETPPGSSDFRIGSVPVPEVPTLVEPPAPEPSRSYTVAAAGNLDEEEQKQHNEARRFARLLVSEIKLYNEQKVLEGRQEKNLYGLLRDDIDKSREMYEKRASPNVAAKVDYFYGELVKILADNHVEALGKDCPGPVLLTR